MIDPTLRELAALLDDPPRAPDRAFVAAVDARVRVERALAAHRARSWRRFAVEVAAGGATMAGAALMAVQPALASLSDDRPWSVGLIVAAVSLAWLTTNRWRVAPV